MTNTREENAAELARDAARECKLMTTIILTAEQSQSFELVLVLARHDARTDDDKEACNMLEDFLVNECEACDGEG